MPASAEDGRRCGLTAAMMKLAVCTAYYRWRSTGPCATRVFIYIGPGRVYIGGPAGMSGVWGLPVGTIDSNAARPPRPAAGKDSS